MTSKIQSWDTKIPQIGSVYKDSSGCFRYTVNSKLLTEEHLKVLEMPNCPQPDPVKNLGSPAIWDLVIEDMKQRDNIGVSKYGMRLQAYNGRDSFKDAYQECLDLAVYLRQAIFERDND